MNNDNKESPNEYDPLMQSYLEEALAYRLFLQAEGRDIDEQKIEQLRTDLQKHTIQNPNSEEDSLYCAVKDLQRILGFVDNIEDSRQSFTKALVYKIEFVKLRMRYERNHSLPHFHIEYKRQYNASYSIETLEKLAGNMPRRYEKRMLQWARQRQSKLLEIWHALESGEDPNRLIELAGQQ